MYNIKELSTDSRKILVLSFRDLILLLKHRMDIPNDFVYLIV
jgi:hypothetical protein